MALDFEAGGTNYLDLTAGAAGIFRNVVGATISCWVKPESVAVDGYLVRVATVTSGHRLSLFFNNGAPVEIKAYANRLDADTPVTSIVSSTAPAAGVLYHLCLVAGYATGQISLYANGVITTAVVASWSGNTSDTDSDTVLVGAYGGTSYCLDGILDDLRFFRRALTAAEVRRIYEAKGRDGCTGCADIWLPMNGPVGSACVVDFAANAPVRGIATSGNPTYVTSLVYPPMTRRLWMPDGLLFTETFTAQLCGYWSRSRGAITTGTVNPTVPGYSKPKVSASPSVTLGASQPGTESVRPAGPYTSTVIVPYTATLAGSIREQLGGCFSVELTAASAGTILGSQGVFTCTLGSVALGYPNPSQNGTETVSLGSSCIGAKHPSFAGPAGLTVSCCSVGYPGFQRSSVSTQLAQYGEAFIELYCTQDFIELSTASDQIELSVWKTDIRGNLMPANDQAHYTGTTITLRAVITDPNGIAKIPDSYSFKVRQHGTTGSATTVTGVLVGNVVTGDHAIPDAAAAGLYDWGCYCEGTTVDQVAFGSFRVVARPIA